MNKGMSMVKAFPKPAVCWGVIMVLFSGFFFLAGADDAYAIDLDIIAPEALQQDRGSYVLLDSRPKARWQEGHIEGAFSFSWEDYTRTDSKGVSYRIWPPHELAMELGKMGINEQTPIIVYGDADSSWGGEGWVCWMLAWLGHQGPIRLLHGGIQAWQNSGAELTVHDSSARTVESYGVQLQPQVNIRAENLKNKTAEWNIIDTRSTIEWLRGRLPDAIHINWEKFYSGATKQPLSPEELKKLLVAKGVDSRKKTVYYCTGGIRSGYTWMVHQLAELPAAINFEGGIEEWKREKADE